MTGTAKIAAVALVAGLMLAAVVGMVLGHVPSPVVEAPKPVPPVTDTARLAHCRTLTAPDPACTAVWDAERRRFFRDDDR